MIDVLPQAAQVAAEAPRLPRLSEQLVFYAFLVVILIVPWMMARGPSGRAQSRAEEPSPGPVPGSFFTSDRERRLWLYTLAVLLAIYSTLSPAQEIAAALRERGLLAVSSAGVMLAVGMVIAYHWASTRPGRLEVGAGLGVAAVYLVTMIRLPVPEARSHLFEYSLVAMLVYQALSERRDNGRRVPVPWLLALVATSLLGWIDEAIQFFLPNRVYDLVDVGLNAAFALMAIVSSLLMGLARRLDVLNRMRRRLLNAPSD